MGLHAIIPPTGKQSVPLKRQNVLGKCQLNRRHGGPRDQYLQEKQPLLCHIPVILRFPEEDWALGRRTLSQGSAGYNPAPDLAAASSLLLPP